MAGYACCCSWVLCALFILAQDEHVRQKKGEAADGSELGGAS